MCAAHVILGLALSSAAVKAIPFDPFFYVNEWEDVCATGKYQTPIDLPAMGALDNPVPPELVTELAMPTVSGVKLKNVGNGLKFEWDSVDMDSLPEVKAGGDRISAVMLDPTTQITKSVKMQPIQMHLHSVSEHTVDGLYYPAELHIVTLVAKGEAPEWGCDAVWDGGDPVLEKCTAVFGILYKFGETSPEWIDKAYGEGPLKVDEEEAEPFSMKDIDLSATLPEDKSYYTYYGSLTTPPCAEGLRWHVFKQPVSITPETLLKMENYLALSAGDTPDEILGYRHNERLIVPLNGRSIWKFTDPAAPAPTVPGCPADVGSGMYGDE